MAIQFVHTTVNGDITVIWEDGAVVREIHIEDTITDLYVQDLVNAIRAAEESPQGMAFGSIALSEGKAYLGVGVYTGITLQLLGDWRIYSLRASGVFRVLGGNFLRLDGGDPFRPNLAITEFVIQSAAATIVTTEGGGGGGDGFNSSDRANLGDIKAVTDSIGSREELVDAIWQGEGGIRQALVDISKALETLKKSTSTILLHTRQLFLGDTRDSRKGGK